MWFFSSLCSRKWGTIINFEWQTLKLIFLLMWKMVMLYFFICLVSKYCEFCYCVLNFFYKFIVQLGVRCSSSKFVRSKLVTFPFVCDVITTISVNFDKLIKKTKTFVVAFFKTWKQVFLLLRITHWKFHLIWKIFKQISSVFELRTWIYLFYRLVLSAEVNVALKCHWIVRP